MTFNDVLLELLANLRTENKSILISWDAVQLWPEGALASFLQLGLISSTSATQSIECTACDKRCFMDIITLPHNNPALTRAYIVCDDADMQSQMGRIQIPLERLSQWHCSIKQVAEVVTDLLGFKDKITFTPNHPVIKLGMLKTKKGRRWVTMDGSGLLLEINKHSIPINEVLYFEEEQLFIDQDCIDELLNSKPLHQGKTYTPSTSRREARKLKTQTMYQDWNDEYLRLSTLHPTKSKTWCSIQIAKMDIAKGRDSESIRHIIKT